MKKSLGKFSIILADPPWKYDHSITENRAVENHCPIMTTEEIAELPVKDICTRAAVLYLFVTAPKLMDDLYVLREWGFEYKSNLVWVKEFEGLGMGYWSRCRHEHLLIGTRGKIPCPKPKVRPESVISAKRGKHSEKPDDIYKIIEKAYPRVRKIELFARKDRKGWKRW